MNDLASRQLVSPSGITRLVQRLEEAGLMRRESDPEDARASFATLTDHGVARLRQAQVTHNAVVRDRLLSRLEAQDLAVLSQVFEGALPGVVTAAIWQDEDNLEVDGLLQGDDAG